MAASSRRRSVVRVLLAVVFVLLLWASPAEAATSSCTTDGATTSCTNDEPTIDQLHELEQEMLYGLALVTFLGAASFVASWHR
jgi:hypothetical protein